ncbi:MAG TPA: enoyl-CoA hydratase/isomerase family protein, partial [Acidimicrobiia bacterium]|nr:enoyl-CoA hydratase/isomerase family protein [Acidimicrobiia bacterium]
MSGSNLLIEDTGPIRRLTLNRPEKLNALDAALVEALSEALLEAADLTDIRVIVIAGAGRSFCAGYDLTEEPAAGSNLDNLTHSLDRLLEVFDHPRPIIAQ